MLQILKLHVTDSSLVLQIYTYIRFTPVCYLSLLSEGGTFDFFQARIHQLQPHTHTHTQLRLPEAETVSTCCFSANAFPADCVATHAHTHSDPFDCTLMGYAYDVIVNRISASVNTFHHELQNWVQAMNIGKKVAPARLLFKRYSLLQNYLSIFQCVVYKRCGWNSEPVVHSSEAHHSFSPLKEARTERSRLQRHA